MKKRTPWITKCSALLLCMYLLLLTFCILFKGSLSYLKLCIQAYKDTVVLQELDNFRFFANIGTSVYHWKNPWLMMNLLINIALFVPLGLFLGHYLHHIGWKGIVIAGAAGVAFSLCYELIQYTTGFGAFDVDDIVLNGTGAIAGYGFLAFVQIRDRWDVSDRIKYVLIQAITNLNYFLCSTSFYYLFHMNREISKSTGLMLAIGLSACIWYNRLAFWKEMGISKKTMGLLIAGKYVQIFIMEWFIGKWLPYGLGGLVLTILIWAVILLIWHSVDKKIKTFL